MLAHYRVAIAPHLRLSLRCTMLLLLASIACQSAVEPLANVTLLVTNTSCDPGPCQTIHVLAFPDNAPTTPGGAWSIDLGAVTAATACLVIPATARFSITNGSTGAVEVTTWTTGDSLSLAPWPTSDNRFTATPTTASFLPGNASSWSVSLPGTSAPTAAKGCTPW